jgi:tripartite-type tricarboxylate transporter receptor subunit TctC
VVQANDPHVLLLTTSSVAIAPAMMRDPGYDPLRDLVPISIVTDTPMVILAKPDGRIRDLADVITRGKAEPGRVSYATTGVGSTTHLAGSLLCVKAAIDLLHVPYRGSAPAATAIYSGDVDLLLTGSVEALPHVRSGRLKAVAVTSAHRMALLPDVPAIAEQVTGYSMTIWYAMFGPSSLPPAVVERLARELQPLANGSPFAKRMVESGATVRLDGPAQLADRLRLEVPQWREVITAAGISPT